MAEESSIPRHPVREHWKERRRRRLESANAYDEEIAQNPELLAEHQCEMKLWDNCLADGLDPEDEEDEEEETDDDASPHEVLNRLQTTSPRCGTANARVIFTKTIEV